MTKPQAHIHSTGAPEDDAKYMAWFTNTRTGSGKTNIAMIRHRAAIVAVSVIAIDNA